MSTRRVRASGPLTQEVLIVDSTGNAANSPSTSANLTSVPSGTSAVDILAANANRRGGSVLNTDANVLYLLLGSGTPSATNCNVVVAATTGYFEIPYGYNGIIRGVWAVDGAGAALVTEYV